MSFATKASIFIGAAAFSGMAVAGTGDASNDLQSRLEAAEAHIAELSAQQDGDWLTEQRSEQIRGIVQDVLADADTRASLQGNGATSGYNNGFFVQSADGKWSMKINGLFQERFNIGHQPSDWLSEDSHRYVAATTNDKTTGFGFETTRAALNFSGKLAGVALLQRTPRLVALQRQRLHGLRCTMIPSSGPMAAGMSMTTGPFNSVARR